MATLKEDQRRLEDSWHLDKKVPISLIIGLLLQSAMVIYAFVDMRKDVDQLKVQVHVQEQRDGRQDADMKEAMALLRESLNTLNSKIDRLIERGSHR